ncbi:MAG: hypothetical protein QM657_05475 [Lacrimispora sp.]|uniref:hypothetical protein n=1 Tax=Lacrimispora sp. TaxID=2719234 RepID=UPI0039E25DE8
MINSINPTYAGPIQKFTVNSIPKNISDRQSSQIINQEPRCDKLELNNEVISKSMLLNAPCEIKINKPREWTIAIEALDSRISHIDESLKKADSLNLSFNDRVEFIKNEGINWVKDVKQNDPEMFVQWLKMNKDNIEAGRSDLASLPSDFTMKDYYSYVKEPFSVLV